MGLKEDKAFTERQLRRLACLRIGHDAGLLTRAQLALRRVETIARRTSAPSDTAEDRETVVQEMFSAWCSNNGIPPGLTRWTMNSARAERWLDVPPNVLMGGPESPGPLDTSHLIPVDVRTGGVTDRWSLGYGLYSVVFGYSSSPEEIAKAASRVRPTTKHDGYLFANDPDRRLQYRNALRFLLLDGPPLRVRRGRVLRLHCAIELHRRLCPRGVEAPHFHKALNAKNPKKYPRPRKGKSWCDEHPLETVRAFVTRDPDAIRDIEAAEDFSRRMKADPDSMAAELLGE